MAESNWLTEIPQLERSELRDIRKTLDTAYRDFSREHGEMIEAFLIPFSAFSSGLKNCFWPRPGGWSSPLSPDSPTWPAVPGN